MSSIHDHQLDALLHRGTTSEVWRATRLGPNGFAVPVALKTLSESYTGSQDHVRSFLKEARAASAVQHGNVVQVRELMLDNNRYWLSMDLVPGWTLRALLAAIEDSGHEMPIPVALALVRDAVRAVTAIHDKGLVHRNLSPDNAMVTPGGHLVVFDFGLATWQHTQRIQFTPAIDVLDPVYSSPELRARLPADARADVYSLGALLDQLIPDRSDAPIALNAIIRRALDLDAARRFPTAQALEVALDLMSIRENWLVPPSYVSAYLSDLFRPGVAARPRLATGSTAEHPAPPGAIDPLGDGPTLRDRTSLIDPAAEVVRPAGGAHPSLRAAPPIDAMGDGPTRTSPIDAMGDGPTRTSPIVPLAPATQAAAVPQAPRAVLPRGRGGMVGVGAMLANHGDSAPHVVPRDKD